jgi:hypothetical protein
VTFFGVVAFFAVVVVVFLVVEERFFLTGASSASSLAMIEVWKLATLTVLVLNGMDRLIRKAELLACRRCITSECMAGDVRRPSVETTCRSILTFE